MSLITPSPSPCLPAPALADAVAELATHAGEKPKRLYTVALVSDFFYPRMGGVEMHQYSLAQCLIKRGHKVILISGTYSGQRQVRSHESAVINRMS